MNTEQLRAEFEAWAKGRWMTLHKASPCDGSPPYYLDTASIAAWEAYQAGRAALQSQDREDAGMAEIVREAAQIIAAIPPEHAPDNIRWPIVDELEGFASKIDHARRFEGEGK